MPLAFILHRLNQFETIQYLECGLELYTNQYDTPAGLEFSEKFGIDPAYLKPLGETRGLPFAAGRTGSEAGRDEADRARGPTAACIEKLH